jgi:hypothetical protein
MIPLHALILILMGRFSSRLYVGYCSWYAIGTLSSMQVPFVGFQPVRTSEHMAALGVFGLLQLVAFAQLVRSHVSSKQFWRRWHPWHRAADVQGLDCSLDWPLLLALGHRLCQEVGCFS